MEMRPRQGVLGMWDQLAGPGATAAENWINITWALLFVGVGLAYVLLHDVKWSALQLLLVAVMALDIAGGISVNASPSAKRWWHRPGQGFWRQLGFVAIHIHPFILAALFPEFAWSAAVVIYLSVLLAALVILLTPPDMQRPVAFILYAILLLVGIYVIHVPFALAWFVPFFALKLLLAHLLPEIPRGTSSHVEG